MFIEGEKADLLRKSLEEAGFYRVFKFYNTLLEQALEMAKRAGKEGGFAAFPSYIPAAAVIPQDGAVLIIDIGGTSTKGAVRVVKGGDVRWITLFEKKNRDFQEEALRLNNRSSLFSSFSHWLGFTCRCFAEQAGIDIASVKRSAVVWSNPMKSVPFGKNITALVARKDLYNKGEWFLEELEDGFDIGRGLVGGLEEAGFRFSRWLISNDTPFTLKALREAVSGVVLSTGINGTILIEGEEGLEIANGEIGQTFLIADEYISSCDRLSGSAVRIEELAGGRFLTRLFTNYIIYLSGIKAFSNLKEAALYLEGLKDSKWREFRGLDISLLINREFNSFIKRRTRPEVFNNGVCEILSALMEELVKRSALLSTLVIAGSVGRQISARSFKVAVDSRLGVELKLFWSALNKEAKERLEKFGEFYLFLLKPLIVSSSGRISVPMLGAANAVDSL